MVRIVSGMRWLRGFVLAVMLVTGLPRDATAELIGFEDVVLPGPESFYNGNPGNPPVDTPIDGTFQSGSAVFPNTFLRSQFGTETYDAWEGWACSNVTDQITPGFENQYSAWNPGGGGAGGSSQYGVSFGDGAGVLLPAGMSFQSIDITNTTYAARSMLQGDSFAKKFGGISGTDPDWFRLTITGRQGGLQGSVVYSTDFYLADYRFSDPAEDYVVSDWTTIELGRLGRADTLEFHYVSSDTGIFGINTPLYFAADNFTANAVPEPSSVLVLTALLAMTRVRRWCRRGLRNAEKAAR